MPEDNTQPPQDPTTLADTEDDDQPNTARTLADRLESEQERDDRLGAAPSVEDAPTVTEPNQSDEDEEESTPESLVYTSAPAPASPPSPFEGWKRKGGKPVGSRGVAQDDVLFDEGRNTTVNSGSQSGTKGIKGVKLG